MALAPKAWALALNAIGSLKSLTGGPVALVRKAWALALNAWPAFYNRMPKAESGLPEAIIGRIEQSGRFSARSAF